MILIQVKCDICAVQKDFSLSLDEVRKVDTYALLRGSVVEIRGRLLCKACEEKWRQLNAEVSARHRAELENLMDDVGSYEGPRGG